MWCECGVLVVVVGAGAMAEGTELLSLDELLVHEDAALVGEDRVRALYTFRHASCVPGDPFVVYLPYDGPVGVREGFAAWHARGGAGTPLVNPDLPPTNSDAAKPVKRLVAAALGTSLVSRWQHQFHGLRRSVVRGWRLRSAPMAVFSKALPSEHEGLSGESFRSPVSLCVSIHLRLTTGSAASSMCPQTAPSCRRLHNVSRRACLEQCRSRGEADVVVVCLCQAQTNDGGSSRGLLDLIPEDLLSRMAKQGLVLGEVEALRSFLKRVCVMGDETDYIMYGSGGPAVNLASAYAEWAAEVPGLTLKSLPVLGKAGALHRELVGVLLGVQLLDLHYHQYHGQVRGVFLGRRLRATDPSFFRQRHNKSGGSSSDIHGDRTLARSDGRAVPVLLLQEELTASTLNTESPGCLRAEAPSIRHSPSALPHHRQPPRRPSPSASSTRYVGGCLTLPDGLAARPDLTPLTCMLPCLPAAADTSAPPASSLPVATRGWR